MTLNMFYDEIIKDLKVLDPDNPLYIVDKLREKYVRIPEIYRDDFINVHTGIMLDKYFHCGKVAVTDYAITNEVIMDILDTLGLVISETLLELIEHCEGNYCIYCKLVDECPREITPSKLTYEEAVNESDMC